MKSPAPCIEVNQLSLSKGGQLLLDALNFQIQDGERIAIVGANGAGKTTLLRCLLGLLQPDTGKINIQGKNITQLARHTVARSIAYVPQLLNTEIPFSVQDFVLMSRYSHLGSGSRLLPKDNDGLAIAQTMMKRAGIDHFANRSLATLSGGERQKASIAAALTQQTPILFLDEPAAHLDPKQQDSIKNLLAEIHQSENHTILTVTHDLNWAAADFDRIIGMKKGKLVCDSKPADFMTTENLAEIFEAQWEIHPHPKTGKPIVIR